MGLWVHVSLFDVGASAGQIEPDVDECAKDLVDGIAGLRRFYGCESTWTATRASVGRIAEAMLRDGKAAVQRQEQWSCAVGDVEVALYPVPDRIGPSSTAHPYGIPERVDSP
ncbi:hypothetical protein [Streptomyces sp. NPDC026673]|uniref:hypothetical protein n=1 Tax=Streptomyces sp. NPDC026673 TaxID=3155724 RepID=UPI0033C77A4C